MGIKNVPYKIGEDQLIELFKSKGFHSQEYFHVPQRPGKQDKSHSMGYAFIGFESPETAKSFAAALNGHKFPQVTGNKVLAVVPAKYDGVDPRNQGPKKRLRGRKPREKMPQNGADDSNDCSSEEANERIRKRRGSENRLRVPLDAPLTPTELASLD